MNPRTIELTNGIFAIIDEEDYERLSKYSWRAVKVHRSYYAKTTIESKHGRYTISMHRLVAKTPRGKVCHHINFNSLDNRKDNLLNMDKTAHTQLHRENKIIVKFNH